MEVPIDNGNLKISGEGYSFCAPIWIGELVSSLDFEVLGTANNHSYDRGIEGINSTIDFFKNNSDIMTVGTYKSEEDRKQHRIMEINGIKFLAQAPIPFLVIYIRHRAVSRNPVNIFRTDRPRFNYAWNRVKSPMKQYTKFLILPFT